ncbi:rhodanese-like domain-containing protein [Limnoglobus roseus]|nr:rhodanese-like domain-containing protein [Limnoglobus roseus]
MLCLTVTWALVVTVPAFPADHTKDKPADVKKAVETDKAVLIDVREEVEWNDGHLKGAKHLPLSDLKKGVPAEKLKELLPKDKVVYVHCGSGVRCLKAADLLKAAGYETQPLKPGYEELVKAGFEKAK